MTLLLGDRVRLDIPDEIDPDFELHGEHAIVLDIKRDDSLHGDVRYQVALEERDIIIDVSPWDVRSPIQPMPRV